MTEIAISKPACRREDGKPVIRNVLSLSSEDSGIQHSIVRFENSNVKHFGRRTPVVIYPNGNRKRWILRYCFGNNGSVKGLTKESIAIDYDGAFDLGIQFGQQVNLVVKPATYYQCIKWLMISPDLNIRLNTRLALLGAVLGLLGLVIGLISLI
jgi:hypothetical protein